MPVWRHADLSFHYRESGQGLPFVFQHGLGGDVQQPFGLYRPPAGVRLLSLDCRGHGQTQPLGDPAELRLEVLADDVVAWLDYLQTPRAVVGGISMGAAVALNLAVRYPQRVIGLVLSRPAWLAGPLPFNVSTYGEIARLIRHLGSEAGLQEFLASELHQTVLRESPDAARSLVGQFTEGRAVDAVARLEQIPGQAPLTDPDDLTKIVVPTLVLANRQDPIHPFEVGQALAGAIAGAAFGELTPKSVSADQHRADVQRWLDGFLAELASGA